MARMRQPSALCQMELDTCECALTVVGVTGAALGLQTGFVVGGAMAATGMLMSIFGGSSGSDGMAELQASIDRLQTQFTQFQQQIDDVLSNQARMMQALGDI